MAWEERLPARYRVTRPAFRRRLAGTGSRIWKLLPERCGGVQRTFRGRLAGTGRSAWFEVASPMTRTVAPEGAARRAGARPRASSAATSHPDARRREGGRQHGLGQARVQASGAGLFSEESGPLNDRQDQTGRRNQLCSGPAPPPEGGEACLMRQRTGDRGQPERCGGPSEEEPARSLDRHGIARVQQPRSVGSQEEQASDRGHQTEPIRFRGSGPAEPCVRSSSEGPCHPRAPEGARTATRAIRRGA